MSRFRMSSGVSLAVITAALAVSVPGLASAADKAAAAAAPAALFVDGRVALLSVGARRHLVVLEED